VDQCRRWGSGLVRSLMATVSSRPACPVPGTGESVIAFTRETPGARIIFGPVRLEAIEDEVRHLADLPEPAHAGQRPT
jgi:hypothetical protein